MDKDKVREVLEKYNVRYDALYFDGPSICCIHIGYGDWKHDHLRLDYIMNENFTIVGMDEFITLDTGCDCYSALHKYLF